jgi:hypothetical protein
MAQLPQTKRAARTRLKLRTLFGVTTTTCFVLAIAVAVVRYSQQQTRYLQQQACYRADSDLATLAHVMCIFYRDTGTFPNDSDGLNAMFLPPAGLPGWQGPYAAYRLTIDPWSHPYRYTRLDSSHFRLCSDGPDGTQNTDDDLVVTSSHFAEGPSVWERRE